MGFPPEGQLFWHCGEKILLVSVCLSVRSFVWNAKIGAFLNLDIWYFSLNSELEQTWIREFRDKLLLWLFCIIHLANARIEKRSLRLSPCCFLFTEQLNVVHWAIGYIQTPRFLQTDTAQKRLKTSDRLMAQMKRVESRLEQQSFILAYKHSPVKKTWACFSPDSVAA